MKRTGALTPDELAAKGRALYGERWQTALARDLHVADRTMRRWLGGGSPIPVGVEDELRAVLLERFNEIGGMIAYDITPGEHTIFHQHSAATFRFDEADNLTPLSVPPWISPEKILLIEEGAKAKLRERRAGRPAAAEQLHGFLRGSVVIPAGIDLTDPVSEETFIAQEGYIHR